MSTIFCLQHSQPSMEATTMKLKLVSPESYSQNTLFSTLQSPTTPHKPIDDYFKTDTNIYVHNQNSLKLSQESLEICTESLGSETGSDTSEDDAIFAYPTSRKLVKKTRRDQVGYSKKVVSRSCFPPPLTTMSGSTPFQVRPHREGGRLIIEAVETTTLGNNCFQAERSHGRLLLTCWKREESVSNMDTDMDTDTDTNTQSNENDMDGHLENDEEEIERNVVVEKFQRLRRCNEDENGDKGICYSNYWEPCCWVATS